MVEIVNAPTTKYAVEIKGFNENTLEEGKLGLCQRNVVTQTMGSNGLLINVSLTQKMFQPSCLEVVLQTKNSISSFERKLITLYAYNSDVTDFDTNENTLVQNYYIFNIKQKGEYVTLTAYSADKFLTIDKFCQAFTGKTLVGGMIVPSLSNSLSPNFDKFRQIVPQKKESDEYPYIIKNVTNFCKDGKESIIPYAVQYNESLYDFMVRMCNRDGEFLYMDEDNKLCIGLKSIENTSNKISEIFKDAEFEYINTYDSEDTTNWVDRNYLGLSFTSGGEKIEEKPDVEGYIYDFNLAPDNGVNLQTPCYVLSPDYLETVSNKKEYALKSDYTCKMSHIISKLHAFGDERNIVDAVSSATFSILHEEGIYNHCKKSINEDYTNIYKNNAILYSTNNTLRNNEGYKNIYKKQEESNSGQLKIVTSSKPNIKLGDVIEDYVVYESIKTVVENNGTYNERHELLLVKRVDSKFYSLPMPEIRIKKASAQRAIVVDNFDPDRLGRVRVMYPWQPAHKEDQTYWKEIKTEQGKSADDITKMIENKEDNKEIEGACRNEINNRKNSTPWIRISNPMASNGAGFLFIPDIKDEVLIDYEDGNIERPYVCGAFYNNTNRPSVASQSQTHGLVKSITSANGHHISFTDSGGVNRCISSIAPLTKTLSAFGVIKEPEPQDDGKYYGGGFEIADYYGFYSITGSTHNRSINISSPMGNISMNALTGITISAPLGDVKIVGKNVSIEARNNLSIESGTNIKGYFNIFKGSEYKSFDDNPISNLLYSAVESEVVDLSLVRNVLEMLIRPIGGKMLIKSNRYMHLEAGDGETIVDKNTEENSFRKFFRTIAGKESLTKRAVDYERMFNETFRVFKSCERVRHDLYTLSLIVMEHTQDVKSNFHKIFVGSNIKTVNNLDAEIISLNDNDKHYIKQLRQSFDYAKNFNDRYFRDEIPEVKNYYESLWTTIVDWSTNPVDQCNLPKFTGTNKVFYDKVCRFVNDNLSEQLQIDPVNDYSSLKEIENAIVCKERRKKRGVVLNTAIKFIGLDKLYDMYEERVWSNLDKGSILFSDKKGRFFKIGEDGGLKKGSSISDRDEILMYFEKLSKLN